MVLWGEGRNITAVSLVAACTYTLCATNPASEIITVTGKNKCDTKHEGCGGGGGGESVINGVSLCCLGNNTYQGKVKKLPYKESSEGGKVRKKRFLVMDLQHINLY